MWQWNGQKREQNENVFDSEVRAGKRCGIGTMMYMNEDQDTGEWDRDEHKGSGELTKTKDDLFFEDDKNDKRNGPGISHIVKTK
jgi:hypothetical protein